jgi:hypothetical protein
LYGVNLTEFDRQTTNDLLDSGGVRGLFSRRECHRMRLRQARITSLVINYLHPEDLFSIFLPEYLGASLGWLRRKFILGFKQPGFLEESGMRR